jgi:hypothetical protein
MARFIINPELDISRYEPLTTELNEELAHPGVGQPYIIEENIPSTESKHVHVVWDAWSGIREEERSQIILEAYRRLEGREPENIAVAVGLLPTEAFAAGLLPYVIQSTRRNSDGVSFDDYQ